jgi:NADH-quinone oxidoreductase subunit G
VRFTDEITKTGEFGIFNRGDHAELGLYPGTELRNNYSANVVDICPVGALTERDFRFKARVWYLSSAPTLCNGCSQGCNLDMHFVLDRPHLNDGARVLRVKPRYNSEVNQWWLCDEGRYGFGWIDHGRLDTVRGPSGSLVTWDKAMTEIASVLDRSRSRIGVIASAQQTNEELFLLSEIFKRGLGAEISSAVPQRPGTSDEFLLKADKNPNTLGTILLGFAGPGVIEAGEIIDRAIAGKLDVIWVFGHDLTKLYGDDVARRLAQAATLIFSGTNANPTASLAQWALPTAAYVERDGTFVNCHGRLQRIGLAFPPYRESREDWSVLLELSARLGSPLAWRRPEQIFRGLTEALEAFKGLSYTSIGAEGIDVAARQAPGTVAP